MKKLIVLLCMVFMVMGLPAVSSLTHTGSGDIAEKTMPTQEVQLTIGDELYSYSVGFSTTAEKAANNIDPTVLSLSEDDRTVATNPDGTQDLYVWWDILSAKKFDITLAIGNPLTEQSPISGDSAAKIDYTVTGTISESEVKPATHTTTPISIASDSTLNVKFLKQLNSGTVANSYKGSQKLAISTKDGALQGKPEGIYKSTLTLTVATY